MLEITVLKTRHAGKDEARKLFPYIKTSDVFSPENACISEQEAKVLEDNWESNLGLSRTQYRKKSGIANGATHRISEYYTLLYESIFRNKIPLWYAERFSDLEQKRSIDKKISEMLQTAKLADRLMFSGDLENGLRKCYEHLHKLYDLANLRDKKIAENLEGVESFLRRRYTQLSKKDPLQLTLQVGQGHNIERYASVPLTTVSLYDERSIDSLEISEIGKDPSFEEARHFLLARSIHTCVNADLLQLSEQEILQKDSQELRKILEECISKYNSKRI
jgi:hypothetical protein